MQDNKCCCNQRLISIIVAWTQQETYKTQCINNNLRAEKYQNLRTLFCINAQKMTWMLESFIA